MEHVQGFQDFPKTDLPSLPDGWKDSTWRNDACPSFCAYEGKNGDFRLRVWIGYADPALREDTNGARFLVSIENWRAAEGQEVSLDQYAGDVWAEVLATVARLLPQLKLAEEFSRLVQRDLAKNLPDIVRRNAQPEYAAACATHDFCDTNLIMLAAWETLFGPGTFKHDSDADARLWNQAWDMARANGFSFGAEA